MDHIGSSLKVSCKYRNRNSEVNEKYHEILLLQGGKSYSTSPMVGKLQSLDQLWPTACFYK